MGHIHRRKLLKGAAVGMAAGAVAAPSVVRAQMPVKWRMVTSWPKTLDALHGSAEAMCQRIEKLTDGKFQIRAFAAGEIVPPLGVADAVQNNTVECGHTLTSFYFGKRPAWAFDAGVAFGLNARQQAAWMHHGGGKELLNDIYKKDNLVAMPCGNVGVQMGGWYRKEIKTVEDLKGLKFRIGGLGGIIMTKLGVVPQQIAPGDIYSSLERGTIDAAEWIGPYDDEKLGFHRVAKFYYAPGWWEGSAQITTLANLAQWQALPPAFREAYEAAAAEQTLSMMAKYDARNPEALKRLLAAGVQVKQFPRPVLEACYNATFETYKELAAKDADFKRVYDAWLPFLDESNRWFRICEAGLDNYRFAKAIKRT
ncbi:MAG: TRAP transporter substrate-binding protein DctP [Alphaproteobacteria bacterium]|nr:TRAP transporter substrate-binding protein DctP [Alphaproteobacteria bacterium]